MARALKVGVLCGAGQEKIHCLGYIDFKNSSPQAR